MAAPDPNDPNTGGEDFRMSPAYQLVAAMLAGQSFAWHFAYVYQITERDMKRCHPLSAMLFPPLMAAYAKIFDAMPEDILAEYREHGMMGYGPMQVTPEFLYTVAQDCIDPSPERCLELVREIVARRPTGEEWYWHVR